MAQETVDIADEYSAHHSETPGQADQKYDPEKIFQILQKKMYFTVVKWGNDQR